MPGLPERDLAEWDAEIEAEFRRAVSAGKRGAVQPRKPWRRLGTFIPRDWELRLQGAVHACTWRLAIELLYQRWRAQHDVYRTLNDPVVISNAVAQAAGLKRRTRRSAIAELERLGLITVSQEPGMAPRAKLHHMPKTG